MNGVQTRFKCKLDVKRCKRFVFPPSSLLPRSNALKTKAIRYFQTDRTLTRIVSPPLVAGICNASVFLGMHGFLNEVKHTSNTLNYLKQYAGDKYTGDSNYINEQAVRDENIVTANGTGQLEFCKEILYALEADTADAIEESYLFYKNGFCPGA